MLILLHLMKPATGHYSESIISYYECFREHTFSSTISLSPSSSSSASIIVAWERISFPWMSLFFKLPSQKAEWQRLTASIAYKGRKTGKLIVTQKTDQAIFDCSCWFVLKLCFKKAMYVTNYTIITANISIKHGVMGPFIYYHEILYAFLFHDICNLL